LDGKDGFIDKQQIWCLKNPIQRKKFRIKASSKVLILIFYQIIEIFIVGKNHPLLPRMLGKASLIFP
jgi:hypothetical protein